ncbi:hypothetical protein RHSIM_RhsimUnG0082100 [Rhododendron simsii]|uniref:Uncharacterized protein n=1 Tax=Rhododendron simsii TaxID=118357 RepID=A0A834L545_RHOSS|nr:hypothetical protein RHSIM_RhsimUnG0082100 [Rhododendron simsii]
MGREVRGLDSPFKVDYGFSSTAFNLNDSYEDITYMLLFEAIYQKGGGHYDRGIYSYSFEPSSIAHNFKFVRMSSGQSEEDWANRRIPYLLYKEAEAIHSAENSRSGFEKPRILDLVHASFAAEAGFDADDGVELAKLAIK